MVERYLLEKASPEPPAVLVWIKPEDLIKLEAERQSLANQVTTLQERMSEMVVERQCRGVELEQMRRRVAELEERDRDRIDEELAAKDAAEEAAREIADYDKAQRGD